MIVGGVKVRGLKYNLFNPCEKSLNGNNTQTDVQICYIRTEGRLHRNVEQRYSAARLQEIGGAKTLVDAEFIVFRWNRIVMKSSLEIS